MMQKVQPQLLSKFNEADLFADVAAVIKVEFDVDGYETFSTHRVFNAESFNIVNDYMNNLINGPEPTASYFKATITHVDIHNNNLSWNSTFNLESTFTDEINALADHIYDVYVDQNRTALNIFIDHSCVCGIIRLHDIGETDLEALLDFAKKYCKEHSLMLYTKQTDQELDLDIIAS